MKFLFLAILLLPAALNAATPTISNVSGTITTGQTLTITGTNMVQDDKTNWDHFFVTNTNAYGFEGSSATADFYCDLGPCAGAYDSSVKIMGSKSIKWQVSGSTAGNPGAYNAFSREAGYGDVYWRWYAKWLVVGGTWADSHIKFFYTGPGNTSPQSGIIFQGTEGTSMPTDFISGTSATSIFQHDNLPGGQLQSDRWYAFEVHINNSTALFEAWVDNVLFATQTLDSTPSQSFLLFGMPNVCCNTLDISHWWDSLAVSSTRIRPASTIEVSNNATYGSGTVRYQEPLLLSDTSSQIKLDLTGLGGGPYWMFITNNGQTRSSAFSLSGGAALPTMFHRRRL